MINPYIRVFISVIFSSLFFVFLSACGESDEEVSKREKFSQDFPLLTSHPTSLVTETLTLEGFCKEKFNTQQFDFNQDVILYDHWDPRTSQVISSFISIKYSNGWDDTSYRGDAPTSCRLPRSADLRNNNHAISNAVCFRNHVSWDKDGEQIKTRIREDASCKITVTKRVDCIPNKTQTLRSIFSEKQFCSSPEKDDYKLQVRLFWKQKMETPSDN